MFLEGDKVHWTQTSKRGRTITMTRKEGTVVASSDNFTQVKTASGKLLTLTTSQVRGSGQRGQIDDFVDAVVQRERPA